MTGYTKRINRNCYTEAMRVLFLLSVFAIFSNTTAMASQQTLLVSQVDPVTNVGNCSLDVGWTDWKPFQYLSAENKVTGLTIELLELIAKEMQCQFIYHKNDWLTSVELIKNGKLDFICSASVTKERDEFALFSAPYYQELIVLYVKSKEKTSYGDSSLIQLFSKHDFKLGMIKGTKFDEELATLEAEPRFKRNFIYTNSSYKLFEMLNSGKIDGYFSDPLIMDQLIVDSLKVALIESYPVEIKTGSLHFMFSKKRTTQQKLQQFDRALAKVLKSNAEKFDWLLQP